MTTVIRPWRDDDLPLLRRANAAEMTTYLGGPEPDESVTDRHAKYLRFASEPQAGIFAIELDGISVGGVNWWQTGWQDDDVIETGWFVVPEARGRGVAAAGVARAIDDARLRSDRRRMIALPDVSNAASNRVCARAGFTRLGEADMDYRDTTLHVAVWSLNLDAGLGR